MVARLPLQAALEAFENADTPYHLVLLEVSEGSPGEGGASFTPLFQSMFFLHDESWAEGLAFDHCRVEPVHIIEKNVARCCTVSITKVPAMHVDKSS